MINENALSSYEHIFSDGAPARIALKPHNGSYLDLLVSPIINRANVLNAQGEKTGLRDKTFPELVSIVSNASAIGDLPVKDITNKISETVKANLYMARNIVLPLVDEYTEKLNDKVNTYRNLSSLSLSIVKDSKLFIFEEPLLAETIRKHSDLNYSNGTTPRYHRKCSIEELLIFIKNGGDSFDEFILDWIKINSLTDKLLECYENIFLDNGSKRSHTELLHPDDYISLILTMVLSWALIRNVQDDIPVSFEQYQKEMLILGKYCASVLNTSLTSYNKANERKQVVIKYPYRNVEYNFENPEKTIIYVNAKVYDDFLEHGGTPEVLYGAYLTDRKTKANELMDNKDAYLRAYTKAVTYGKLANTNNLLAAIKNSLYDIANMIQSDIARLQGNEEQPQYKIELTNAITIKQVDDFVQHVSIRDAENVYTLVRNFICSVYFKDTEIQSILDRIDYLDPNGEMDMNDLAIIAVVDFLVSWLCGQVDFSAMPEYGLESR